MLKELMFKNKSSTYRNFIDKLMLHLIFHKSKIIKRKLFQAKNKLSCFQTIITIYWELTFNIESYFAHAAKLMIIERFFQVTSNFKKRRSIFGPGKKK